MTAKDPIANLFDAIQETYDYFDFTPDWVICPFRDDRAANWFIDGDESGSFSVFYSFGDDLDEDSIYTDEGYRQRFYSKWVYRGEKYTMIFVDTYTDGMKYFSIVSNDKELKENPF